MKKHLFAILLLALILMFTASTALANQWGLPGGLTALVEDNAAYDEYDMGQADPATANNRPGTLAVFEMKSRYHRELFVATREDTNDAWTLSAKSTLALHQGEDASDGLTIALDGEDAFYLYYPGETYRFERHYDTWTLTDAVVGDTVYQLNEGRYVYNVTQGEESFPYYTMLHIGSFGGGYYGGDLFSIERLPKTVADVQHMQRTQTLLAPLGVYFSVKLEDVGSGTLPVYSAPDKDAVRFGNGKASVGLAGELRVLDWRDGFMQIFYRVSGQTARIGYVQATDALVDAMEAKGYKQDDFDGYSARFGAIPAVTRKDTFLTDDPYFSQYAQIQLPKGTPITGVAVWEAGYAMVETEQNGKPVRGFVPLDAIEIEEPAADEAVMASLIGTDWFFEAGGIALGDYTRFTEDGVYAGSHPADYEYNGRLVEAWVWRKLDVTISRYDPAWNLFWDEPKYMLTTVSDEGYVARYGFDLSDDGESYSMTSEEGGGGSARYEGTFDGLNLLEMPDGTQQMLSGSDELEREMLLEMLEQAEDAYLLEQQEAEQNVEVQPDSDSGLYSFIGTAPGGLNEALAASPWAGAFIVYGKADKRFGDWEYAEMILKDKEGFLLCCGIHGAQGWELVASRDALRQGEMPLLECEADIYGYTDKDVEQMGGCGQFDIIYPDARYHWMFGTYGPMVIGITRYGVRLDVSRETIAFEAADGVRTTVYATQDSQIEGFRIADYPTTREEALAQAETSPMNDDSLMTLTNAGVYSVGVPVCAMREAPKGTAKIVARYYDDVKGEAFEEENGYTRVRIGDQEGWILSHHVLRGGERAAGYSWSFGQTAIVYAEHAEGTQPLYAAPDEDAQILAYLPNWHHLSVMGILDGNEWFHVCLTEEDENGDEMVTLSGYMRFDAVSSTDNYYDYWVYSDDPKMRLNLREAPDKNSESIGRYYSGVRAIMLYNDADTDGYLRVIIDGVSGYMDAEYLLDYADYNGREWLPPLGTVQGVNSKGLNLRAAPNSKAEILNAYPVGTKVEILAYAGGNWAHVRTKDGYTGYMMLQYLGGEPKQAVKNEFTITQTVQAVYYDGTTSESMPTIQAGTKVRISERPRTRWYSQWLDDMGASREMRYGIEPMIYVATTDGEGLGYVPVERVALDW